MRTVLSIGQIAQIKAPGLDAIFGALDIYGIGNIVEIINSVAFMIYRKTKVDPFS